MRIIDADVLKDSVFECEEWWENADVWIVSKLIDSVPIIHEFKEGKWIPHEYGGDFWFRCSECGDVHLLAKKFNFCPKCGAKMEV